MMTVAEVKKWLATLNDNNFIAIDDGGLAIVEVADGKETDAYLEIGGVPGSKWGDDA